MKFISLKRYLTWYEKNFFFSFDNDVDVHLSCKEESKKNQLSKEKVDNAKQGGDNGLDNNSATTSGGSNNDPTQNLQLPGNS